jgi:5-methylcytosine-specific restriction endonuclease McrA
MPQKRQMPYRWETVRNLVVARDKGICHLCGEGGADTADHIIPHSRGGSDELTNLRAAHRYCNVKRGNHALPRIRITPSRFG